MDVHVNKHKGPGEKTQFGVQVNGALIASVVAVLGVLWAVGAADTTDARFGVGVAFALTFIASASFGCVIGFLFGLPRSRYADVASSNSDAGETKDPDLAKHYLTNSNLVKVSDWLTTIVVGLGLTQLAKVDSGVRALASALRGPLGDRAASGLIGITICCFGLVAGFNLMYLWVSIRVRELLEESENQAAFVPDFQRLDVEGVKELASQCAFDIDLQLNGVDAASPVGQVSSQDPRPGSLLRRGKTVKLEFA